MSERRSPASGGGERSQSNVIAVVLLTAIVVAGASAVVFAGSMAVDQRRSTASCEAATESLQDMGASVERHAGGGDSGATVTVPDGESLTVDDDAGRVEVQVEAPNGSVTTRTARLGAVRFDCGEETVAYQGGGVWRTSAGGDGSVVVSPPTVNYRRGGNQGTLNFPVVTVEGHATDSAVQIDEVESRRLLSSTLPNPVEPGTSVTLTVHSEYYEAWGEALTAEFGERAVTITPGEVTVSFKSPPSATVDSSILATNVNNQLQVYNFGEIDSYDSSTGPYGSYPENDNADVVTNGSINAENKMSVRGDLVAEEGISGTTLSKKHQVYGRTILGDDPDIDESEYLEISGKRGEQRFRGLFSTQDNLQISQSTTFGGDVLVGGDLRITATGSHEPTVENGSDVVVRGEVPKITNADITGDLLVHGDAENIDATIHGDLVANGHVELESGAAVHGDLVVPNGSSPVVPNGTVHGNVTEQNFSESRDKLDSAPEPIVPDVPRRPSAGPLIDAHSYLADPADNDNDAEALISGNRLDFGGTTDHTLGPGSYYLERLDVPGGETLTLDTSGGGVTIYVPDVDGQTAVQVDGRIEVTGPDPANRVEIYVDDAGEDSSNELTLSNWQSVVTPGDRAGNLWVYLAPTADAQLGNGAHFEGVIYGAGVTPTSGANILLGNHAILFGSMIGDIQENPNHARIHFDEALVGQQALSLPPGTLPIDYAHFTQQRATVDD